MGKLRLLILDVKDTRTQYVILLAIAMLAVVLVGSAVNAFASEASVPVPDGVLIRVLSGGVKIHEDGSVEAVDGGKFEMLPYSPPKSLPAEEQEIEDVREEGLPDPGIESQASYPSPVGALNVKASRSRKVSEEVVPDHNRALAPLSLTTTCYQHTATQGIGATTYRRITDYCVNDFGNEVFTRIRVENIGDADTPVLYDEEIWGRFCPNVAFRVWSDGSSSYILTPGTHVEWEPWREVESGWNQSAKVRDVWEGAIYYNCIGH